MQTYPGGSDSSFFSCRKCGTQLFTGDVIVHANGTSNAGRNDYENGIVGNVKKNWTHELGPETSSSSRFPPDSAAPPQCSSVFLSEAPSWVDKLSDHDGRITCPKCRSRVGSFSWSGATCSCGRWVTPAFQFQLSRVDARRNISIAELVSSRDSQPS